MVVVVLLGIVDRHIRHLPPPQAWRNRQAFFCAKGVEKGFRISDVRRSGSRSRVEIAGLGFRAAPEVLL